MLDFTQLELLLKRSLNPKEKDNFTALILTCQSVPTTSDYTKGVFYSKAVTVNTGFKVFLTSDIVTIGAATEYLTCNYPDVSNARVRIFLWLAVDTKACVWGRRVVRIDNVPPTPK